MKKFLRESTVFDEAGFCGSKSIVTQTYYIIPFPIGKPFFPKVKLLLTDPNNLHDKNGK